MNDITSKLLKHGGERVAQLDPAWDDGIVLGGLRPAKRGRQLTGKSCRCHRNASAYWLLNFPKYNLFTGYGLSEDGIWRRHSWLETDKEVVETTSGRIAYYGVQLADLALFRFIMTDVVDCLPEGFMETLTKEGAAS